MVTASSPTLSAVQRALISKYDMDGCRILELARQYAVQSTINYTGAMLADAFIGTNATFKMPADIRDRIECLILYGTCGGRPRFLGAISDMGAFGRWKADAERIEAFNSAVAYLTATVPSYRRFLALRELDSYNSGVFLKGDPEDIDPDQFVSFTVGFRHAMFEDRQGMVDFPAESMRDHMMPVRYSPFMRINDSRTERILDEKDTQLAYEAEARIRINSRVPKNLQIMIKNKSEERAINMVKEYGDLGSIKFG